MKNRRRQWAKGADKAPAYQWFPKDAKTDEAYLLMTHEERGVYRDLLDHQWLHGSIPSDLPAISACAGGHTSPDRLAMLWPKILPCFATLPDGRLQNDRLERQRTELQEYHDNRSDNGRKGAAKRWRNKRIAVDGRGMHQPLAKNGSAPASASATASARSAVVKNTTADGQPPKRKRKGPDLLSDPSEPTQVDALVKVWNEERKPGPKAMLSLPDARREQYGRALCAKPNLDDWRAVIRWLNTQAWANAPGIGDHPNWRAHLDWLARPGKLAEYLERVRLDAVSPPGPAYGPPATREERARVDQLLKQSMGRPRCDHTPTCEFREDHITRLINDWRHPFGIGPLPVKVAQTAEG